MAQETLISWCDATFNPWIGCTRVSPACDDCYAARSTPARTMGIAWGPGQPRHRTSDANWRDPLRWAKSLPAKVGRRPRVFCASLADVFDNEVPVEWRIQLFRLIAETPELDWLLLTKRIGNAHAMLREVANRVGGGEQPIDNVWLGATVVDQEEADRDIPKLLEVSARVRFVSIEPMLGDIRLGSWLQRSPSAAFEAGRVTAGMPAWTRLGSTAIDWVIAGGESGPKARPMHPAWVRSLRDQCAAAGVPFHFKQWGEWVDVDSGPSEDEAYDGKPGCWVHQDGQFHDGELDVDFFGEHPMYRVGKRAAGRLLDGAEHNGFPEVRYV